MIYVMGVAGASVVKIGTAANPAARLRSIQAGYPYPLAVLFEHNGGRTAESWLHSRFAHLRMSQREWFDFGDLDPIAEVSRVATIAETIELERSPDPDWGRWAALASSEHQLAQLDEP